VTAMQNVPGTGSNVGDTRLPRAMECRICQRMSVDGNVWTRPFEIRRQSGGVADAREVYTFVSRDKQFARLEISTDKGAHWTLVNEAVGTHL
jgi:hypothetical protein